ncbi:MAG TPA: substrate-binding domain-containing protein [Candidatus Aquilonibacter sp.]|jgi:ribose transport system substrate-binding protein|nr:substrate-binding domain-containing protein [Candidatus Aquilonibacter sp.]
MLRSQRTLPVVSLLILVASLLSCGAHDSNEYFVFVAANLQVPYWQAAGAGFTKAGAQFKVRTDFLGPNTYDPKAERDALDQAVQQKATGILLGVTDPTLLKDSIDKAIAAGIPVITMDSDAPASKRLFFIGTNNYEVGTTGGMRLAQELKGKGNVVVFTMPDQRNMQERLHGYRDALERTPGIKITRVVDIQGDPRIAFDTTTQIVGKEKDQVDAFVCLEAQSGKEVAGVLNSYHINGKVVMAMDTDPETLDFIKSGVIAATISQKPYTMAFVGMQMLDNLYHHKPSSLETDWSKDSFAPIPSFVDTGSALIDKSNVDSFLQARQSATGGQK